MKTCKVCSRPVRKTVLALVMIEGKLKGARVCQDCERHHGVTIVVAPAARQCKCGKPAIECGGCAHKSEKRERANVVEDVTKRVRSQLAGLKMAHSHGPGPNGEFMDGKIEAYEAVLSMLEEGRA